MSREDRNYNHSYMLQEMERVSQSPETFLARWFTKASYDAAIGKKDEVKTNLNYLIKLYHKQNGRCAACDRRMTHVKGSGRVRCNISVARKNKEKTFNSWNIELLCTKVHHDILWRWNFKYKPPRYN